MIPHIGRTKEEIQGDAREPIACRTCGLRDGLIVEMRRKDTLLIGKDLWFETPLDGKTRLARSGWFALYECPRCGRRVLVETSAG